MDRPHVHTLHQPVAAAELPQLVKTDFQPTCSAARRRGMSGFTHLFPVRLLMKTYGVFRYRGSPARYPAAYFETGISLVLSFLVSSTQTNPRPRSTRFQVSDKASPFRIPVSPITATMACR